MAKYDSGGIDSGAAILVFTFVVGSFFDWYFNHPSDTHWWGVGAAFVLLMTNLCVSNTETRVKRIEAKLDAALEKLASDKFDNALETLRGRIRGDLQHEMEMHEIRTGD